MTSIFPKATWSLAHAPASLEFADDRNCLGAWTGGCFRDPRQMSWEAWDSNRSKRIPTFSHELLCAKDVQTICHMYVYWLSCFKLSIDVFLAYSTVKSDAKCLNLDPIPIVVVQKLQILVHPKVVKFTWRVNSASSPPYFCSNSRSELSKMAFSENWLFHGIPFHPLLWINIINH
jgi:hypothetical protein